MKYIRNNNFILRNILGENILFPTGLEMKSFQGGIQLNDISKEIWEWLVVPLETEEIVLRITEEYEIDYNEAKEDISELLNSFLENNIIMVK